MRSLYKTPYGSRLYGTNTPSSDYDYKIIGLPYIHDLLIGKKMVNVVQSTGDKNGKNTADDVDVETVPVQIFCKDFIVGQTYALELAFSIVQCGYISGTEVYDAQIVDIARHLIDHFLTANVNSMVGYAYNQARVYSVKGDRLDTVEHFGAYLVAERAKAGKDFQLRDLIVHAAPEFLNNPALAKLFESKYLALEQIEGNDGANRQWAINLLGKFYPESILIDEAIRRVNHTVKEYGARARMAQASGGRDWKAISHAVRIANEAVMILRNHFIPLPYPTQLSTHLVNIKNGEVSWENASEELESLLNEIDKYKLVTTLPIKDVEMSDKFNAWLADTMYDLYKLGQ